MDAFALHTLLDRARAARRSIRRSGFVGAEGDIDRDGFIAAAEPLAHLVAELDRLLAVLDKRLPSASFGLDRERFGQVFEVLHGDVSKKN